jgi:hypothetical protein
VYRSSLHEGRAATHEGRAATHEGRAATHAARRGASRLAAALLAASAAVVAAAERPAVLRVGPERALAAPSAAARVARDGDVVEIDAGLYEGDVAVWPQSRLTLRGVGGRAHLRAAGAHAEGKAIWVLKGARTTVENIEFSGAAVPHRNGAGIRLEGAGLTVRNCYFHGNENGILAGNNPQSDVLVERSEFARNGHGDGYSHNIYVGAARSFILRASYVHRAVVGHNVKSRARRNHIAWNLVIDGDDGRASYAIDLPDGGLSFVVGNAIQQGPAAENDALVAYGAEGLKHPVNELYLVNNTLVNDLPAGGRFIFVSGKPGRVRIVNNAFSGPGQFLAGPGELANNLQVGKSGFRDPARFDYRLARGAAAIGRGMDPGAARGAKLTPSAEYVHPAKSRPRRNRGGLDLGAFEYRGRR